MGNKKQSTRKDPRTKKRTPFKGNRYTYRASSQAQEVVIPGDEAQDVVIPGDEAQDVVLLFLVMKQILSTIVPLLQYQHQQRS